MSDTLSRSGSILLLLLACCPGVASARDLFVVQASGVANVTASSNSLPEIIGDAVAARGAFTNLGDTSATLTLNYAGVPNALMFQVIAPPSGIGTYSATISLPGFTRTFTATSKPELRDLINDFLDGGGSIPGSVSGIKHTTSGSGDFLKALKDIYAATPVTITDGTPHASTAVISNREFEEFGLRHGLTNAEREALVRGVYPASNAFGVEADYARFTTRGGFKGSTTLVAPTLRLGDRWGFVFSLPVRQVNIQGAVAWETGLLMGMPVQLVSQADDMPFFWQVTPFVHSALAASYDLVQATIDIGGGFNNRFGWDFDWCSVQVASQIGFFDGIDISGFDIGVEQQVLKNGLKLSVPIGEGCLFEVRAVRTDFLKEAAVPVYYTFGADFVYRSPPSESWLLTFVPDDFQLGALYETDLKSYSSFGARAGIRWRW